MYRLAPRLFNGFFHHIPAMMAVRQSGRQHKAQHRTAFNRFIAVSSNRLSLATRHTCGTKSGGSTLFFLKVQKRSTIIPIATIEQSMIGNISQPPLFIISNTSFPVI